jgi:hypothetical protein
MDHTDSTDTLDETDERPASDVRSDALRAYHAALHAAELRSDDPLTKARALVAIDDAREAYRAAGGRPGSRWSASHQHTYLDARELLGEDVTARRAELAEQLAEPVT